MFENRELARAPRAFIDVDVMERTSPLLITGAWLAFAAAAHAHPPPAISRIVWKPDGEGMVLRTNRGLLFGDPTSHDWRMLCTSALGIPYNEQPDLAYLPDGRLLAATTRGLRASADEGCSWQAIEPYAAVMTTALAQHPSDPARLYLAIADGAQSGVYETRDAGATWSMRLHLGASDYVTQLLLAPSSPERIYASGLVYDENANVFSYQLTRSDDAGVTWRRFLIPLQSDENEAVLHAVSPINPDVLLAIARNQQTGQLPDRWLASSDGGVSWRALAKGVNLLDAGFAADGSVAYAAGDEALYRSDAALMTAAPLGAAQLMSCVTARPGTLYACGNPSGFDPVNAGVGVSSDGGENFSRLMAFTEVKQTVSCPAGSPTTTTCQDLWTDWQLEILVGVGGAPIDSVMGWQSFQGLDASVPDPTRPTLTTAHASAPAADGGRAAAEPSQPSAGAPAAVSGKASSGCGVARARGGYAWLIVPGALWLERRRRRQR